MILISLLYLGVETSHAWPAGIQHDQWMLCSQNENANEYAAVVMLSPEKLAIL